MPADKVELIRALEDLVALLRRNGELHWSKLLDDDLFFLRKGDVYGAERFLTYFGGMGSLNDLWLCRANGHSLASESEQAINEELQRLRVKSWVLAKEITGSTV